MLLIKQLFTIVLIFISTSGSSITPKQSTECCEEYCYEEDTSRPQYKSLGVFTPYTFVKGNDTQIYNIPGCTAEKIWMMLRDEIVLHYDDTIPGNNSTLPEKGRLCDADFNLIKNWKWDPNFTAENDGHLTVSGWIESKELGKDYRNAFPDIFGNVYSSEKFRFAHTDNQKTEATYKAFVEGLFGDGSYKDITLDQPPKPNMMQYPWEFCEAFRENRIAQSGPDSETFKFRNTEIFRKLRNDVSVELGFYEPAFQPLSDRIITYIYAVCRFEKTWNVGKSSPWCSVPPSQFKIIEYLSDLGFNYTRSYGFVINSKIFCSGMNEMLSHLTADTSLKLFAYFGHTYQYHAYLTALGAFKDTIPLRNDNFDAMANRKWKNNEFNPVASNIAAVKYNCANDVEEKTKVKFFVNQKTLNFDWCDSNGVCKLPDVLEKYSLFRDGDCEETFCSSGDRSGDKLHSKLMSIFFSVWHWLPLFMSK